MPPVRSLWSELGREEEPRILPVMAVSGLGYYQ